MKKVTAPDITALKGQRKISMVTAYDYPSGQIVDAAEVDMILVGDSLGMVVLGYEDTLSVTMDDMLHHAAAVSRGAKRALIVGDLPFMAYQPSVQMAVENAGKFLSRTGARAVKLEGGFPFLEHVRAIIDSGIPVQGHIGLTPQHVARFGGFKAQGKNARSAAALVDEALALEAAGCFSIVLEAVPHEVAQEITARLSIPTIGIGAGPDTDGQVLVYHDILGLFDRFVPMFVKKFAQLRGESIDAVKRYIAEVSDGSFPAEGNFSRMDPEELKRFKSLLQDKV
ncbi:3-methyl-2-oxobutanoate hydroxymethyltransferase [Maridesulfovibrio salexigens]|uniref:3-methyl-2-oxobutanoate hydroxymethyltransferase n=1 Tax=Maridesulfovibrio salexigens (strain ATCC 14822 / DSM 2638 / NCIMB 8403 / VKM B-1763) TaxID=526222 RepID=C6BVH5_MARSD|nr:3-methyl-2-oxobutanoate hydroxymethyltransferase [Maridesulfovibrio salexigens]ACS78189.1 3-methyl-2-oxobutanoate hydroxymethyltransferase [Maridesulfovibrio salexigens DSM 2638]